LLRQRSYDRKGWDGAVEKGINDGLMLEPVPNLFEMNEIIVGS